MRKSKEKLNDDESKIELPDSTFKAKRKNDLIN